MFLRLIRSIISQHHQYKYTNLWVGAPNTINPFHYQDTRTRKLFVNPRNFDSRVIFKVFNEVFNIPGFLKQRKKKLVHLLKLIYQKSTTVSMPWKRFFLFPYIVLLYIQSAHHTPMLKTIQLSTRV